MIPICGKPILQCDLELLVHHGIREVVVNLHHLSDVITDYLGDGSRFGARIVYSHEPQLLGTAGAIKKMESFFDDTFLVVYADNLLACRLDHLMAFHEQHRSLATIALHFREDVSQSGVVDLDESDRIKSFEEKPDAKEARSHWVNAGLLVLEPEVLDYIPRSTSSDLSRDTIPGMVSHGEHLYGYRLEQDEGPWWIDTPADLKRVQMFFSRETQP